LADFLRPRLASQVAAELAGHQLEEDLGLAVDAATADLAANARRGYEADLDDFEAYCVEHRVLALPATPAVIAAYLAVRADRPPVLALAILARRLAAIRKVHDRNGYRGLASPGRHPDVQRAWAGIRRQRTWIQQHAPEAGADQVRAMVAACPLDRFIGVRDRALLLLHYVLATRRSELVALDVEDLVLVDQGLVAVVWRRKTDQERSDLDLVAVPYMQESSTCPVRARRAWQEAAGLAAGPAFRAVHPRVRLDSPEASAIQAQIQAAAPLPSGVGKAVLPPSDGWPDSCRITRRASGRLGPAPAKLPAHAHRAPGPCWTPRIEAVSRPGPAGRSPGRLFAWWFVPPNPEMQIHPTALQLHQV
jgi:hypothetical protein